MWTEVNALELVVTVSLPSRRWGVTRPLLFSGEEGELLEGFSC
jgi:hypothetical protein